METFEKLTSFFMSPQCHEELFVKFNFLQIACLKMILSKCLGYGILAGSLLLRVPQIINILKANSAKGLSVLSELLQLVAIFGMLAYGYTNKFSIASYGDSYFLYAQGFIILALVFFYQRSVAMAVIILPIIIAATSLLFLDMLPKEIVFGLNGLSLFLSSAGKLIQIRENWLNSSTGVLSAFTLVLQFLGCVARIFTSIQETGDTYMIVNYVVVSIINGILVWQLYYYWDADKGKASKKSKSAKKRD